ncbi:MAG: CopG family transcriptional regulator [Actinobacteria bacterium]|nr:CopG family transcriptional regulator [Actinomycetota bacterium]
MGKIDDILAEEATAVEAAELGADQKAPLPEGISITRGHPRAKNLQVRFRDDEFEQLSAYAAAEGLPLSTVVRLVVMKAIAPVGDLEAALDRLETDLAAVRRKALSV